MQINYIISANIKCNVSKGYIGGDIPFLIKGESYMDDKKTISTTELIKMINSFEGDFIVSVDLTGGEDSGDVKSVQTK